MKLAFALRPIAAALVVTASAVAASVMMCTPAAAQVRRWGENYFPNITVLTHAGRSVPFYDDLIKGRLVVISFIYTSCRDLCPLITARMAQVQERLGAVVGKDIFFLSISIDPDNDTPEKLKEHAEAFRVGPGWEFITGKRADMELIRRKLGERSRYLGEHGAEIILGNDREGVWARDSAFGDLHVLVRTIRSMDSTWRIAEERQHEVDTSRVVPISNVLPGQVLFAKTCSACHTVGEGQRVGPDLRDVAARRTRDWLMRYIATPDRLRAEKDPIALGLAREFKTARMPNLGLSANDASDIIAYLEFQSFRSASTGGGHVHHRHEEPAGRHDEADPKAADHSSRGHQHHGHHRH